MANMILTAIVILVWSTVHCQRHNEWAYSLIDDYCPENCFCPRLEEVWCKNVPMTGISDRMWPKLENLTIINAEMDRLRTNMFSKYPHLKRLHLESIKLRTIEPNAFFGLPRLRSLRLFGNNIDQLDKFDLSHLSNVKEIYLAGNNIKRIGKDAFFGCSNIGTLDLRHNPVRILESGAFNGLKQVERLLLPSDLVNIEPGAFSNLSHVHYLEIRQWKAREGQWAGVAPRTFDGLKNVKTLQIEKSDLGIIGQHAFEGLTAVEYLYIRNSRITRVRKSSFAGMRRVRRLGLTKNFIDRIDYMAFEKMRRDDGHQHHRSNTPKNKPIRQLDISKNRLNCTCPKNAWILYEEEMVKNHTHLLRNNTCSWPAALDGADLLTASIRVRQSPCQYGHDNDGATALAHNSIFTLSFALCLPILLRFNISLQF